MTRLSPRFWRRPFAHRGLHDASRGIVENGVAAIEAACRAGYGIEIDIQRSAEDEAMVFHDATLDRLTPESGPVDARDAATLERIGYRHGEGRIPTLGAVLGVIGGRVPLLVEVKDPAGKHGALEARCAELCAAYLERYPDSLAVMSFAPVSVGALRDCAPEVPRGLVAYDYNDAEGRMAVSDPGKRANLAALADFEEVEADFVSYGIGSLPRPEVTALREAGVPIFCWTVRSPTQAERARSLTDQITFEGFRP